MAPARRGCTRRSSRSRRSGPRPSATASRCRPLGESGEERTLNQLEEALRDARAAPTMAVARIQALVERDIADLAPALEQIADERLRKSRVSSPSAAKRKRRSLAELLEQQRERIAKASAEFDPNQLLLPGIADDERREREADRRHWQSRLARLESEIRDEPERIRASYDVHAHRLEPVGLVYLWPAIRVTRMAAELKRDPDLEWLDHVQPVGLVVAPILLKELGLAPSRQTQADSAVVAAHVERTRRKPGFQRSLGLRSKKCSAGKRGTSPAARAGRLCRTIFMSACRSTTRP